VYVSLKDDVCMCVCVCVCVCETHRFDTLTIFSKDLLLQCPSYFRYICNIYTCECIHTYARAHICIESTLCIYIEYIYIERVYLVYMYTLYIESIKRVYLVCMYTLYIQSTKRVYLVYMFTLYTESVKRVYLVCI